MVMNDKIFDGLHGKIVLICAVCKERHVPRCSVNKKNEEWLTRRHFNRNKKTGVSKKKSFAKGLSLSLDKPKNELDEILFPIMKKYI